MGWCSVPASGGLVFASFDADALLVPGFVTEADEPVRRCEERVVAAHPDVGAGMEGAPALSHDDRAAQHVLAVAALDAESLACAVPPVLAGRAGLLVCHRLLLGLGGLGRAPATWRRLL